MHMIPSVHHAPPDFDDDFLVACGKTVGYVLTQLNENVTGELVERFIKELHGCRDCVKEIKAKIAADAAPPQSNVQTAVLPKSKPGAGPDPAPR